jgi:hypothetical protein
MVLIFSFSLSSFLTRKDFLNRCDVRAFETEKDARLAKSATRLK